jgi:hypothetical protein
MIRRLVLVVSLVFIGALALSSSASASYHLIQIRQIHPSANPLGGDWVELQMYSSGENFVSGKLIRTYDGVGNPLSTYTIANNVPNGENQRTILISNAFTHAGVSADLVVNPVSDLQVPGTNGAVCYLDNNVGNSPIDCVAYGTFTGSLPVGTPAADVAFDQTLERSVTKGCSTALDPADDTNNSSADFSLSLNGPRNNATTPTEVPCAAPAPSAGGTFNLKAAIKKCKKKFPKGPKRKKCIKKAKRKAGL